MPPSSDVDLRSRSALTPLTALRSVRVRDLRFALTQRNAERNVFYFCRAAAKFLNLSACFYKISNFFGIVFLTFS